jgi:hypothetical protein
MDKKIPIYFDTIVLDSPLQDIPCEDSNAFRLHVGVFTKYKNRNGSYITDEYADFLIKSATRGNTPVVGFFDPEENNWASHTGPKLANGYGYIESFDGWTPMQDTDGVTRDYAIFSVVLFTDYYEEARKIKGQHQSMELNPETIEGDWAEFDGEYYYVYTKGNMLGLCVIGSHEPCFSVSSFFSKEDDTYKSQYEKFSSLLSGLKEKFEEAEKKQEGGGQPMEEFEKKQEEEEVVNPAEEPEKEEKSSNFEAEKEEEEKEEEKEEETPVGEEKEEEETPSEPSEFEKLQASLNELQTSYNELQTKFEEATNSINEFNKTVEELREENAKLQAAVTNYQALEAQEELNKKNNLIEKYEKVLSDEEITPIKEGLNDFSYDELEGKLAIVFANKQMTGSEEQTKKVPLPEPEKSSFALLIEKYRRK